jgi:hypothetical protein
MAALRVLATLYVIDFWAALAVPQIQLTRSYDTFLLGAGSLWVCRFWRPSRAQKPGTELLRRRA